MTSESCDPSDKQCKNGDSPPPATNNASATLQQPTDPLPAEQQTTKDLQQSSASSSGEGTQSISMGLSSDFIAGVRVGIGLGLHPQVQQQVLQDARRTLEMQRELEQGQREVEQQLQEVWRRLRQRLRRQQQRPIRLEIRLMMRNRRQRGNRGNGRRGGSRTARNRRV